MVVARKKAVGAEYDFFYQKGMPQKKSVPQKKKRVMVKRYTRTFPFYKIMASFLVLSCFLGTALAYTYVKAQIACLNWELSQSKKENMAIMGKIEKVKLEIAHAESPPRIRLLALGDLGMIEDPRIEYLAMQSFPELAQEKAIDSGVDDQGREGQFLALKPKYSFFQNIYEALALQGFIGKG